MKYKLLFLLLIAIKMVSGQTIDVDLHFNRKHTVGGIDHLERSRFITIHSANYENLKQGGDALMDYLINDLDVYYGRETGKITSMSYSYPDNMTDATSAFLTDYAANTTAHGFESSQNLVVSGQYGIYDVFVSAASDNHATAGTNYGDFISQYLSDACGTGGVNGMPRPKYIEILNEPLWDPIDQYLLWLGGGPTPEEEVDLLNEQFLFHRETAREIHRQEPGTLVGGFAEAFPDPERRDFFNWDTRWKYFIDSCGADMDYFSFHLYDILTLNNTTNRLRKGGNMEALMDMLSHYSTLILGEEKPFVVTEYGARPHWLEGGEWSSYRDWLYSSSLNSMMVQFMDRPDMIEITIPYIMAVWQTTWTIFRPDITTATFTDFVKFYQLWHGVEGTRLHTRTSDLDLQVLAYTSNNTTSLVLNNLDNADVTVNINELGVTSEDITSVMIKHFHYNDSESRLKLDTTVLSSPPSTLTIGAMGTSIVQYTTSETYYVDTLTTETRNYASDYKQPITANTAIYFDLNGLILSEDGNATLRIGLGREHGLSLQPTVTINDTPLDVPTDFRGDIQTHRNSFFGILEIEVPYNLLQADNTVSVEFTDNGGWVSSLVLRSFNFEVCDGCMDISPVKEFIAPNSLSDINIYPNPAKDYLNVDSDNTYELEYKVYNVLGRLIEQDELKGNTINVSELSKGVYILKLERGNEFIVKRFVKSE